MKIFTLFKILYFTLFLGFGVAEGKSTAPNSEVFTPLLSMVKKTGDIITRAIPVSFTAVSSCL